MKDFGDFRLFTTSAEIEELKQFNALDAHIIRTHRGNEGILSGYTVAIYNRVTHNWRLLTRKINLDDCISSIRNEKELCLHFPEVFGNWWTEISDIYVYKCDGEYCGTGNCNWGLHGIVVETCVL